MLINNNFSQSCNFKVKINDYEIKHTTCIKYHIWVQQWDRNEDILTPGVLRYPVNKNKNE